MNRARVVLAYLVAPAFAPLLIASNALNPTMAGVWVVALAVAAFTYGTTLIVAAPAYFLFQSKKWFKWWHFVIAGAVLGLLQVLVGWSPLSFQGLALLGPGHAAIGAVTGFAFWFIAFAGNHGKVNSAA